MQVIWKGTNMASFSKGMDAVAQYFVSKNGLQFFDTHEIIGHFKEDIAAGCCTDHRFHFGSIAHYRDSSVRVTVSSMVTQALLGMICNTPIPAQK